MPDGIVGQLSPDGSWRWDGTSWVPATRSNRQGRATPNWLPIGLRSPATWRVGLLAAVVALLIDQALRVNALGLGASLALAAAAVALWISAGTRSVQGRAILALSVAFAAPLALRASPWLTIPDLVVSILLLATAASLGDRASILDLGFAEAGVRILHGLYHLTNGSAFSRHVQSGDSSQG